MQVLVILIAVISVLTVIQAAAIIDNTVGEQQQQKQEVHEVEEEIDEGAKKCPAWGKWETSKCLWPNQNISSIPSACMSLPKKPKLPEVIKQYALAKQIEIYSIVQNLFKLRGANKACGRCSRKIKCRQSKNGEFKMGCPFVQARIVDEECQGTEACVIKPILGACPPPIPMPPPRKRRPGPRTDSKGDQPTDQIDQNENMGIEVEKKNASQGPPLWHCARNQDGSKCYCCCGWYFPNPKTGKCVNIRKEDEQIDDEDSSDEHVWNWSGLMNLDMDLLRARFNLDAASSATEDLIDQVQSPPMEETNSVDEPQQPDRSELVDQIDQPIPSVNDDDGEPMPGQIDRSISDDGLVDQPSMPDQSAVDGGPTAQQVVAPVTDTMMIGVNKNLEVKKKSYHDLNKMDEI